MSVPVTKSKGHPFCPGGKNGGQHTQSFAKRIDGVREFRFYALVDGIKQLVFGRDIGIGPPRAYPRRNLLSLFS